MNHRLQQGEILEILDSEGEAVATFVYAVGEYGIVCDSDIRITNFKLPMLKIER